MTESQGPNQSGPGQGAAPDRPGPNAPQPGWPPPAGWSPAGPQPGWQPGPNAPQPGWQTGPNTPQPGWPPPAGWPPTGPQPGWQPGSSQAPHSSNRRGCLVAVLLVVGLIAVLVVGCAVTIGPAVFKSLEITNDSNGLVTSTDYNWFNGQSEFRVHMAPSVPASEGPYIACSVVRPALRGSKFEGTRFEVVDTFGDVVATDQTSCP